MPANNTKRKQVCAEGCVARATERNRRGRCLQAGGVVGGGIDRPTIIQYLRAFTRAA